MKSQITNIITIASILLLTQSCGSKAEIKEEKKSINPLVELSDVVQKTFTHTIKVQGNVETTKDILITAEMGGLITSINVKTGQTIAKGSIIATIDASVLSSNLTELNTQLDYANYMLSKQEELKRRGVGSEFDLEAARNQVKSLEAKINSLTTQKGKATIVAPFTGVVDQVFGKQGQMAGAATPIIRLVNNNDVDIVASISEKHLSNIHVGTSIRVSFPNYKDTTIHMKITNVGNYIEPINRTFRVMASIEKNTLLLPNMLAEVEITDVTVNDGTVVPASSLLMDQNDEYFVYIAKESDSSNFQVNKVSVDVLLKHNGEALITPNKTIVSGVKIVSKGAKGISNKDFVRVK